MKRVIIVGSPRTNGRSAHLAEMLFETNIAERPEDELFLIPVSEIEVGPCIGCGACRELTPVILKDDSGNEASELRPRCVFDDDMQGVYDILDDADELTIVSPVYFSGAPAVMKCILDRLQPYFWANTRKAPKRPAALHVVGEGGDPHGYDALVSEVKSATAVAGFKLGCILDWVGKIDADGEIVVEADVFDVAEFAHTAAAGLAERESKHARGEVDDLAPDASAGGDAADVAEGGWTNRAAGAASRRPKLDLSADRKPGKRGKPARTALGNKSGSAAQSGKARKASDGGSMRQSGKPAKQSQAGRTGGPARTGASSKSTTPGQASKATRSAQPGREGSSSKSAQPGRTGKANAGRQSDRRARGKRHGS